MEKKSITLNYPVLGAYTHKYYAIELNTLAWKLLEKQTKNEDEKYRAINAAHASLYHWSEIGEPVNLQRGEWLISHVYAEFGYVELAKFHADKCFELTQKHDLKDFDLAYGYEALARVFGLMGEKEKFEEYYEKANEASNQIENEDDKKYFLEDLKSCVLK